MKQLLFSLCIALLIMANPARAQQTIVDSILYDGVHRSYNIYVPAQYSSNTKVPLLINMHRKSGIIVNYMDYGDFRYIADTANFIIVHPQGLNDTLGVSKWNFNPMSSDTTDDIGFLDSLIDHISLSYNIDSNQVFSTGFSQGGFMSFYLACNLGQKIAGIGAVGGSLIDTLNCRNNFPMPIIQIHGTSDPIVGYNVYQIAGIIDLLVDFNSCDTVPTIFNFPNIDTMDNSTVTQFVYTNQTNGVKVEHLRVNNGTHSWPGTIYQNNRLLTPNYDIDASEEIWRFFSNVINNQVVSIEERIQNGSEKVSLYPNPSTGMVNIDSEYRINSISIRDINGREVYFKKMDSNTKELKIQTDGFSEKFYFVQVNTAKGSSILKMLIH